MGQKQARSLHHKRPPHFGNESSNPRNLILRGVFLSFAIALEYVILGEVGKSVPRGIVSCVEYQ